ncbi:MAG TPA: response regulator [Bryobacteraceae bacterium]|nr:response regulator [Bryobacteraceae bacterium]
MASTQKTALKILYIEDNPSEARLFSETARTLNLSWHIANAEDGEAGLSLLKSGEERPDVIVLDLNLPGMDGLELLRHIKADKDLKDIRVIVFADLKSPSCAEAYRLSALWCVPKPMTLEGYEELLREIGQRCSGTESPNRQSSRGASG